MDFESLLFSAGKLSFSRMQLSRGWAEKPGVLECRVRSRCHVNVLVSQQPMEESHIGDLLFEEECNNGVLEAIVFDSSGWINV